MHIKKRLLGLWAGVIFAVLLASHSPALATYDPDRFALIALGETRRIKPLLKPPSVATFKRKYYRHNAWAWSYRARSALLAYEVYSDLEHIKMVLEGALYYEALGHSHENLDGYGWYVWRAEDRKWFRETTAAGLISIPIIDLLLLSRRSSDVAALVATHADKLKNAVVRGLGGFEDDYRTIGDAGYYMRIDGRVDTIDHIVVYAVAQARLYELTGEERLRERVAEFTRYWLASTTLDHGALTWPLNPTPERMTGPGEHFQKATVTIELPAAAARIDIPVPPTLSQQIIATLRQNLLPTAEVPWFRPTIAGGTEKVPERKHSMLASLAMWHLYDCDDPALASDLREALSRVDSDFYLNNHRAFYGVMYSIFLRTSGACRTEPQASE